MGDGTGLVDPVTGEGIFYALKSARIAALAIDMHLKHRQPLSHHYNHQIKIEIESEILRADILARMLYSFPAISNRVLKSYGAKIGAKHLAVYLGAMTYRQLFNYVLSPKGIAYLLRTGGTPGRFDDRPLWTASSSSSKPIHRT